MTKRPASFAASKIGWSARQSLKSITPREGFVAPTTMHGNTLSTAALPIRRTTYCGYRYYDRDYVRVGFKAGKTTHLTPLSPAATIFWKMSSQRSGTGRRKVWNSPELKKGHIDDRIET